MLNKKLLAILIIILALIILIGLIYFLFLAPVKEKPLIVEPTKEEPVAQKELQPAPVKKKKTIIKTEVTEEDLKRLVGSFVERYGSYSNQSGYDNLRDLMLFMSSSMQIWANNFIAKASRQETSTEIYYGLTTKAVVVETKLYNEYAAVAEFLVKTQRKEAVGSTANIRTFQQDAVVELVKEAGMWKVDRVVWEE